MQRPLRVISAQQAKLEAHERDPEGLTTEVKPESVSALTAWWDRVGCAFADLGSPTFDIAQELCIFALPLLGVGEFSLPAFRNL